jgi:serine/threonine protein kinase
VLEWLRQLASALRSIHQGHVLHRDLKTSNILLQTSPDPGETYPRVKVAGEVAAQWRLDAHRVGRARGPSSPL